MAQSSATEAHITPNFAFEEPVAPWNISAKDYIIQNNKTEEWNGIATASVVFNRDGKVLVVQRASHDSMPNRWETPGGAVDASDPTILHAAARELWEESGLVAKRFTHPITYGPNSEAAQPFSSISKAKTWCRFSFHVEVDNCEVVKLDPNEHQDFAWVSEQEVREERQSNRELPITTEAMADAILGAFRLKNGGQA